MQKHNYKRGHRLNKNGQGNKGELEGKKRKYELLYLNYNLKNKPKHKSRT